MWTSPLEWLGLPHNMVARFQEQEFEKTCKVSSHLVLKVPECNFFCISSIKKSRGQPRFKRRRIRLPLPIGVENNGQKSHSLQTLVLEKVIIDIFQKKKTSFNCYSIKLPCYTDSRMPKHGDRHPHPWPTANVTARRSGDDSAPKALGHITGLAAPHQQKKSPEQNQSTYHLVSMHLLTPARPSAAHCHRY